MTLPDSPFKGLAFFGDTEHDRMFFFGREREAELVAANLMASRLTVLYGPSGVGKSSLLRAAVVQRLRALVPAAGTSEEASEVVIVDAWRDDPVAAVAAAAGARDDTSLADALAERALASGGTLYLILDQMEEYVLYHGRDGGPLADDLEEILTTGETAVHVLLGVRDDSLADLDAFKRRLPGLFGNLLRLDHLTRAAARSAIEGPLSAYAELGGARVVADDELVEAVLDEVATGRIEQHLTGRGLVDEGRPERRVEAPYLQLVLERLWHVERERGSDRLQASTLAELGGAERIVEEHLERALSGFDADERDLVARLFNHLVTPSGTKIAHGLDDLARYANEDDLLRLETVLAALDTARILRRVPGRTGGPPRYEIFHDVLAPAVIAWRARHEAERALLRERAAAKRRHRRVAAVAVVALILLAGMTALAAWALSQRADARTQARAAEAGALAAKARQLEASALVELDRDPQLSLLLATRAAMMAPGGDSDDVLRRALRESRVRSVVELGGPVSDLAALPGGLLAAVTERGGVRLIEGGRAGRTVVEAVRGAETWLSGGLALTVRAGRMDVRSLPDGKVVASMPVPPDTRFAAAGPQGKRFIVAGRRGATVIDREGRTLVVLPHPSRVERAAFSPNGRLIATGGADGDARLWTAAGGHRLTVPGSYGSRAFDVGFSRLGSYLVIASSDGSARVLNLHTGKLQSIMALHSAHVRRAQFGLNEDALLTGSRDRTARTWKVESGAPRALFAGHTDTVTAGVFLAHDRLATGSADGTVRIWVAGLQPDLRPSPSTPPPRVARDPRAEISGSIVTLKFGARDIELRGHTDDVLTVEISRDGTRAVTASEDGDARIWDTRTGHLIWVLRGHSGTVFDASFSPDGRLVVTGGPATAGLWDARTGERIYFLRGDGGPVLAAAFASPTRVVIRGRDGVRVFNCDTCGDLRELVALARRRLSMTHRTLSADERARFLGG